MSFLKPQDISEHVQALSHISASVEMGTDTLIINVSNSGSVPVNYVGFTAILPNIDYRCPYNATGVKELEIEAYGENCIMRISLDVQARGKSQVKIRPSINRMEFDINILGDAEGEVIISVNDTEGRPVEGAFVSIGRDLYATDIDGIARMNIEGGTYEMKVSKAGYESQESQIDVRSKGFGGIENSTGAYVFYVVVIILLAVVYFFRQMIIFHAFDKTGKAVKHARKMSDRVRKRKLHE